MWLRKTRLLPGGAPGGFVWETDQDVVEVPDDLGLELVAIPDAGFSEVAAPTADAKKDKPADEAPEDSGDAPTAAPKRGRPRKTTQSQTEISE
jgi:hypothetical protein